MNIKFIVASYLTPSSQASFSFFTSNDVDAANVIFSDLAKKQSDGISVLDRSLNYGDGCFTTIYFESGNLFTLDKHLNRLAEDALKLGISICALTIKEVLRKACVHFLSEYNDASAIKILVSRGSGGRGYEPPLIITPQVVISLYPTSKLNVCKHRVSAYKFRVQVAKIQMSSQPLLAGIKHLNRLEQVFAKQELQQYECDDLLLCNHLGELIEATASNVFYLKNGVWITPQIVDCGVDGVMRKNILEFMTVQNINYEIKIANLADILDANALFLCNAIKFIVPVSCLQTPSKTVDYDVSPSFQMLRYLHEWIGRESVIISKATT